jgi:hypothetical protein
MHFIDAGFKGHILISVTSSFLRTTYMHLMGYKECDFGYLGALGTWNVAGLVALIMYEIAARIMVSRRSGYLPVESLTPKETMELV